VAGTPAGLDQPTQICLLPAPHPVDTWNTEEGGGAPLTEGDMVTGAETEAEKDVETLPV